MTSMPHGLTKYDSFIRECTRQDSSRPPLPQVFGRIAHRNPITGTELKGKPLTAENVIHAFTQALDAMEDENDDSPKGKVGAGMTFFGQFVDHDITLDATIAIGQRIDPRSIRNVRTPALDLDCVYGDGMEASPHLYHPEHKGFLLFGNADNPFDLARNSHGTALIGDFRNDENGVLSQLQGAFIALHNICMSGAMATSDLNSVMGGIRTAAIDNHVTEKTSRFEAARRAVRLHYQWLVIHDLLPAFVDAKVLQNVIDKLSHGDLPAPFKADSPIVPIEFSGAAYRFGHATVRNRYTINTTIGDVGLFDEAFRGFMKRKKKFNVEFKCLFDVPGRNTFDKARPVGRSLPSSIFELPFIEDGLEIDGIELPLSEARKLPHRNIFRDRFALELASGQQMAAKMGVPAIPAPKELTDHGIDKTPLWYYCLQEAESFSGKLGPVGGTIVATTILRLLYFDDESLICSAPDFKPWQALGATKDGEYSMGHMLAFVEKNRGNVDRRKKLYEPR